MKIRYVFILYLLSLLFMGLFHIATTPIFEGFDENAHYSYIRQIAYQGKISKRSENFLDQAVVDYQGPISYSSGQPPFNRGMVYHKFFNRHDLVDSYITQNRQNTPPTSFSPSLIENWQSQHPPLYYALMAPILKLVDVEPLVTQIFILRSLSYVLALVGVALGVMSIMQRKLTGIYTQNAPLLLGFVIYPIMLPMFFPEFARIGNDSLCVLLVGLLAYLLSKLLAVGGGIKLSLAIGVTLGLGLLTKAFFIPIAAAMFMFFLVKFFACRFADEKVINKTSGLLWIFLPAIAIGGTWYAYNYLILGGFSGSNVAIELAHKGGGGLTNMISTFSLPIFSRAVATSLVTFVWGGTWSLTHLPHALYVPVVIGIIWIFGAFCYQLRKIPLSDTHWLTVWLVIFFLIGFSWHAIVSMMLGGNANTPGWYLHILLPFFAPAVGVGVEFVSRKSKYKFLFLGLLTYSLIFYFAAVWSQLALFSGCAIKGNDKQYEFQSELFCFDHFPQMINHLDLLGYPLAGLIGFLGWVVCSVLLVISLRKYLAIARV